MPANHPEVTCGEYEQLIARMDLYITKADQAIPADAYYALGLCGEAGEAADKIKKLHRDGATDETLMGLALELGDVLWYLTRQANRAGFSLYEIMGLNIQKLQSRHARGTAQGSGDNR